MLIEPRESRIGVAPGAQRNSVYPLVPFLALTAFFPATIVIVNFLLGVLTPTTLGLEDEFMLIDPVWRLVQGQRPAIDFHHPLGFGLSQTAAMLWRLLGAHCYVLRVSAALFAVIIILCACVVAIRRLRHMEGIAALFCMTVAFVATGPSIYGIPSQFGATLSYDRLLMAGLLVLFVHSFAKDLPARLDRGYTGIVITAVLLNIIFLVKISGVFIGLAIIIGGSVLHGHLKRNMAHVCLLLLVFAGMVAIDFIITGIDFSAMIRDYRMAGQGRIGAVSAGDILAFAGFEPHHLPVLAVVVLLALYAVSRDSEEGGGNNLWRWVFIIGSYWVCEVVLNLSNTGSAPGLVYLAPAAAVAAVTWTDTSRATRFCGPLWSRFHPRRLDEISVRQLIPPLVIGMVLIPEVMGLLRAVKINYTLWSGRTAAITITANKGVAWQVLKDSSAAEFVPYLSHAINAIERLGQSSATIANLDFANPFPALFLAPAPKGVQVIWAFDSTRVVPVSYRPSWLDIIGDACIVMEPRDSPVPPAISSKPLIEAVKPHLASAFTLVYEDNLWKIWKRNSGCADAHY
jgi:hypothetical protein